VAAFLDEHWRADITLRTWWRALADARLAFPAWPEPCGRGWDGEAMAVWRRQLVAAGAIGPPTGLGTLMGGPVLLAFGTPEQQQRWLPALADGTDGWCQLFSEPGAGSDLAGLTTTATRDGDQWVVTGQKVWTSGADQSAFGMLVARTDWDAPKHRGLSYFILPMDQPGIVVRPLRQMNGGRHFSEVFLDGAVAEHDSLIGDPGQGWRVAAATLQFERQGLGAASISGARPAAGEVAGQLDRPVGAILAEHRAGRAAEDATTNAAELAVTASLRDTLTAPLRRSLAELAGRERVEPATASRSPLLAKLAWTERLRRASAICSGALGADGMLRSSADDPRVAEAATFVLSVPSASIAGGTDEIQRNIIAERALGLPRELVDVDRPFRELPRNA